MVDFRSPPQLSLNDGEVHVWRASLDQPGVTLAQLRSVLSTDELERAARFRFDVDRSRFVVARGTLRTILSAYLHTLPESVQFKLGAHGKPMLDGAAASSSLHFNVAHSRALALFAFARGCEVGVDVEYMRDDVDYEQVAERFFSPCEQELLRAVPSHHKRRAFYDCWTRKEAFIKAVGLGLSYPLDRFDVSLAPDERARLLAINGDTNEAARWTMRSLDPASGYAGALVVSGRLRRLQTFERIQLSDNG